MFTNSTTEFTEQVETQESSVLQETSPVAETESNVVSLSSKGKSKPYIASTTQELLYQSRNVAKGFEEIGYPTLRCTPAAIRQMADKLEQSTLNRNDTRRDRPTLTRALRLLKAESEELGSKVRHLIRHEFPKAEYESKFREFGFIHKNNKYGYPGKFEDIMLAVQGTGAALAKYGFSTAQVSKEIFVDLHQRMVTAYNEAAITDSYTSANVGTTTEYREQLQSLLRGVIHIIQAEEPDTWDRTLRTIGFRREKN